MKLNHIVLLLSLVVVFGCNTTSYKSIQVGDLERSFHIRYVTSMKDCPLGADFRLWIPVPQDDIHQKITNMTVTGPVPGNLNREAKYGNLMYYFEGACSASQMDFTVEYEVARHEYSIDQKTYRQNESNPIQGDEMDIYLKPSTLCFVTPQVKNESVRLTEGIESTIEKARAFYDHILDKMTYDKNHKGWGRGDIIHACDIGKGNCTDFHTYFTALCLADEIPSRFQTGMWGRYDAVNGEYKTRGYHCWAEFHVAGQGWVPVDISEADRSIANKEKFFGSHTGNRVTLNTGRDIILSPAQSGAPLNYFVNPYAEIGNTSFSSVKSNCFWTDIPGS